MLWDFSFSGVGGVVFKFFGGRGSCSVLIKENPYKNCFHEVIKCSLPSTQALWRKEKLDSGTE